MGPNTIQIEVSVGQPIGMIMKTKPHQGFSKRTQKLKQIRLQKLEISMPVSLQKYTSKSNKFNLQLGAKTTDHEKCKAPTIILATDLERHNSFISFP